MAIRETVTKRIGHGATIGIVVAWLVVGPGFVMIGLVGVEVWEGRDGVRVCRICIGFRKRVGGYGMGVSTGTGCACEVHLGFIFHTET